MCVRSRRGCQPVVGRHGDGPAAGAPRCAAYPADYHLTFASDVHPHGAAAAGKTHLVAATLLPPQSPCISPAAEQFSSGAGENDYFRTWQLQRHVSCPVAAAAAAAGTRTAIPSSLRLLPSGGGGGGGQRRPLPEHIYESPRLERREIVVPPPSSSAVAVSAGAGGVGGTAAGECTCCEPVRCTVTEPSALAADSQLHTQQYYELDHQSARPALL